MIDQRIDKYAEAHTTAEDKLMEQLNRETHLKTYYPNMLSGKVQGKVLEMISRMIRPRRILEVGTFTGYSALALAKGLAEDGKLITLEVNEEMEGFIRQFIRQSAMADQIELLIGDAQELIASLDETFDLVFIDADKEQYADYYRLVLPKVRSGGFLIADNVLWGGKVLDDDAGVDKETQGIRAFNELVLSDDRVEQVMLTVRDGLMLIRKL